MCKRTCVCMCVCVEDVGCVSVCCAYSYMECAHQLAGGGQGSRTLRPEDLVTRGPRTKKDGRESGRAAFRKREMKWQAWLIRERYPQGPLVWLSLPQSEGQNRTNSAKTGGGGKEQGDGAGATGRSSPFRQHTVSLLSPFSGPKAKRLREQFARVQC